MMSRESIESLIISCLNSIYEETNIDAINNKEKDNELDLSKVSNKEEEDLMYSIVIPNLKTQATKNSDLMLHSLVVAYLSSRIVDLLVSKKLLENNGVLDKEKFKYYLTIGSLLHDYGKVCWESDLFERKSLGTNDWNVIKNHPIIAYNILKTIFVKKYKKVTPSSLLVLRVILLHHKNYDWGGYPKMKELINSSSDILNFESLREELVHFNNYKLNINTIGSPPLEVRIVRIADSLAAMIEGRVYKEKTCCAALPLKEAIEDLKRTQEEGIENGEIIYDPQILSVLLKGEDYLNWKYKEFITKCGYVKNEVAKGMSELL